MQIVAIALIFMTLSFVSARSTFRIDSDSHVMESMNYFRVD